MTNHPNYAPAVENLQRYLRRLAYDEPTIPQPPVDGIFESQTEAALREFQRLRGLPVTGRADLDTWERLYDAYRASLAYNAPPRPLLLFPLDPEGYTITRGSEGFAVTALQYMLRELAYDSVAWGDLSLTGIYDEATQNAVRAFQDLNRLPTNGNVGVLTWNNIADRYNALFSKNNLE